jgi:hypothetical protein
MTEVESWVPREGETNISARIPKELDDYIVEVAMICECNKTEAIITLLNYARRMDEIGRWFREFHDKGRIHPHIMKMLISEITGSKKVAKKYVQQKRNAENCIPPAMIDGQTPGRDAFFSDKMQNRTTTDGFLFDDRKKALETAEDAQEKESFAAATIPAGGLTTEPTRDQHDKGVKRRAKRRKDTTLMSGEGWA